MTVEELLDSLSTNYLAQDLYVEAWRLIHSAIAAAREEGAEQEREKILGEAEEAKAEIGHVVVWTEFEGPVFIISASVLAPKEEK